MDKFIQGLVDDADLQAWFESFEGVDQDARCSEFLGLAQRMELAGEHPELIRTTSRLAEPGVYSSVREMLQERIQERIQERERRSGPDAPP